MLDQRNDGRHQCAGTTRAGARCRVLIGPSRVFCAMHRPLPLDEAGLQAVAKALRALGVLKEGERQLIVHSRADCPVFSDRTARCVCGTAVRIEWADYDEAKPGHKVTTMTADGRSGRARGEGLNC